jgi:hypothetical protein
MDRPWSTEAAKEMGRDQRKLHDAGGGATVAGNPGPAARGSVSSAGVDRSLDRRLRGSRRQDRHRGRRHRPRRSRRESERSHAIRAAGFSLLRFTNRDIAFRIDFAIADIRRKIERLT